MTVNELIEELQKIEDKEKEVVYITPYDDYDILPIRNYRDDDINDYVLLSD